MGEQRRIQTADAIYLVGNRCIDEQPFMAPTEAINTIIKNNLAWAADTRGIDLYAYNFRPSSMFMIVSAPLLNLGRFMGDFQGLTARQINAEIGRTGKFFAGRYRARRLLDNNAIIEAIGRVLCETAAAGSHTCDPALTERPPGVSSLTLHRTGEALIGERENRTRYRDIKRSNPHISEKQARLRATKTHTVELAKLPMWSEKAHMNYHRAVCSAAESHKQRCPGFGELTVASARELGCRHAADVTIYFAPMCVTTDPRLRDEFGDRRKLLNHQYDCASARLRRGRGRPRFPEGMIPPHKTRAVGAPRRGNSSSCSPGEISSMKQVASGAVSLVRNVSERPDAKAAGERCSSS